MPDEQPEVTEWVPGDPAYRDAPERGHCSNSACGTSWVPAGAKVCPECGASAGPACSGGDYAANVTTAAESFNSVGEIERRLQVLHLQPDDVLLIGNFDAGAAAAQYAIAELRRLLPSVRDVIVFAAAIDVRVLREVEAEAEADRLALDVESMPSVAEQLVQVDLDLTSRTGPGRTLPDLLAEAEPSVVHPESPDTWRPSSGSRRA
jgi:hypothetical protein